jgi:hypothetical protein
MKPTIGPPIEVYVRREHTTPAHRATSESAASTVLPPESAADNLGRPPLDPDVLPRFVEGQRLTSADLNRLVAALESLFNRVAALENELARARRSKPAPERQPTFGERSGSGQVLRW